jgi:hypothetical protein
MHPRRHRLRQHQRNYIRRRIMLNIQQILVSKQMIYHVLNRTTIVETNAQQTLDMFAGMVYGPIQTARSS